ncbi:hypothetical protein AMTRI_Chr11g99570 [Amborella trichopoda]
MLSCPLCPSPFSFSLFQRNPRILCGGCRRITRVLSVGRREKWVRPNSAVEVAGLLGLESSQLVLDKLAQSHDLSQLFWVGPIPGDLAEIEAYCRIFRTAEQLHMAVMDSLCNPETGECVVSYESTPEELSINEEKVVAVLGCMNALLNRGREEVLSGRSSVRNSFHTGDLHDWDGSKVPPLAIFRDEMKNCCRNFQSALEHYLAPFDNRRTNIWRRLQRLKNVCYDAGFPRADGDPCQTIFANWAPVYLSTGREEGSSSKDGEIAFWRGGQVTDEGLAWLIDKGYKTIVDLRAEEIKDECYETAIEHAVSTGKINLVKLPVQVGTAPSREQVEMLASLLSDNEKQPLYLHSQEGVWRTSAMVSRWRQYTVRCVSQLNSTHAKNMSERPFAVTQKWEKDQIGEQNLFPTQEQSAKLENGSKTKDQGCRGDVSINEHLGKEGDNGISDDNEGSVNSGDRDEVKLDADVSWDVDPFKTQFPTCNIFSRKEMSNFFRSRKISPESFFLSHCHSNNYDIFTNLSKTSASMDYCRDLPTHVINLNTEEPGVSGRENGISDDNLKSPGVITSTERRHAGEHNSRPLGLSVNGSTQEGNHVNNGSLFSISRSAKTMHPKPGEQIQQNKNNAVQSVHSIDEDTAVVKGNMCASATGVVRVQSRKKAEMYLVRTDGFSCTREKVTESSLAFTHPSTQQQMLMWKSSPKTVLLLKKLGQELMEEAKEVASFLYYQEKMNVLVEPDVHDIFARIPGFGFVQTFYNQDTSDLHERVDFVACLGGDGVILHASNLFRGAVPPVVSFNLGSLGFLTSHTFEDFRQDLRAVIHGNNSLDGVYITLRMRLHCEIYKNGKAIPGKVFDVLNEVVVDRGSNPYLSKIECYEHNRLITKVQGDGVIVATPTGSTAYSTAAGGSMVHPNVPCMLFTPICPHSLSFRPVILPDSARLELKIPDDTRSNAWVSFDGKRRQQLSRGDSIQIQMSEHPLPTVNKFDQTGDWFLSLIRCLNWNERLDQKAL